MTEMCLNDSSLLHVHKDITDAINLEDIAKEFVTCNVVKCREKHFLHVLHHSDYIIVYYCYCNNIKLTLYILHAPTCPTPLVYKSPLKYNVSSNMLLL